MPRSSVEARIGLLMPSKQSAVEGQPLESGLSEDLVSQSLPRPVLRRHDAMILIGQYSAIFDGKWGVWVFPSTFHVGVENQCSLKIRMPIGRVRHVFQQRIQLLSTFDAEVRLSSISKAEYFIQASSVNAYSFPAMILLRI